MWLCGHKTGTLYEKTYTILPKQQLNDTESLTHYSVIYTLYSPKDKTVLKKKNTIIFTLSVFSSIEIYYKEAA